MQYRLQTPLCKADLSPLAAGDTVLLSGVVYTARDAAHARMMELLDQGLPLPFALQGAAVYYVGPTPERPGCAIGAAGPTTAGRMDSYTPRLLDLGLIRGTRVTCIARSPWGDPAAYLVRGAVIALRDQDARDVAVCPWPAAEEPCPVPTV